MSYNPKGTQYVNLGNNEVVTVGGITLRGVTTHKAESSQNGPTHPVESGLVLTSRQGPDADEGTISAWVDASEFPALKRLKDRRNPVRITTPDGSYPTCIVDNVSRTMQGQHPSSYKVDVQWREVLQGSTSTSDIQAVTSSGAKSAKAGSGGHNGGNPGLVPSKQKNVSNSPKKTGQKSWSKGSIFSGTVTAVEDTAEGVGDWAGSVASDVQAWASDNISRELSYYDRVRDN